MLFSRKKENLNEKEISKSLKTQELCTKCSGFVPGGHFYSPIPNIDEIKEHEEKIFAVENIVEGLDLNLEEQRKFLLQIEGFYGELPFSDQKKPSLRYYYINDSYSYSDAIFLYGIIRTIKPKKIIEVGCGMSSCVTLDTNELFFRDSIETLFIEPYPDYFYTLMKPEDKVNVKVIQSKLQDVSLNVFEQLDEGDILFIDSTHVCKTGSDVNYIFGKILPCLKKGVLIHFHDVFYPFEYPKEWVCEGRAWNEAYVLRSFLQYNEAFKIVAFNTYLERYHVDYFKEKMPLCLKNTGGCIWIQRKK